MRVIAGIAKGRRLQSPSGDHVRPTTDRIREALFSVLQPKIIGSSVLDAFAGTGALGIEALSRGAAHATFIEKDERTRRMVVANLETCGFADRATVLRGDAATVLAGAPAGAPFDLALLDPPYAVDRAWLAGLLRDLVQHLAAGATVTLELARRGEAPTWPVGVLVGEARRYGDTLIHVAAFEGRDGQSDAGEPPA